MRFVSRSEVLSRLEGKSIAVVGSGPGALGNAPSFVDGHDVVVRVNNYKLSPAAGFRCDVYFAFFGTSIRKSRDELIRDGVKLCIAKLPNADVSQKSPENVQPLDAAWHQRNGKMIGLDYRPHYARRLQAGFWFCNTCVPTVAEFMVGFNLLGQRMPSTGFAAILDVFAAKPARVHLTGFDFFASGLHNVDEPWKHKNHDDPYRHAPERERGWLAANIARQAFEVSTDEVLARALSLHRADNTAAA